MKIIKKLIYLSLICLANCLSFLAFVCLPILIAIDMLYYIVSGKTDLMLRYNTLFENFEIKLRKKIKQLNETPNYKI